MFPQPLRPKRSRVRGVRGERLQEFGQSLGAFFPDKPGPVARPCGGETIEATGIGNARAGSGKESVEVERARATGGAGVAGGHGREVVGETRRRRRGDSEGEYLARGEPAPPVRARGHGYDLRWVEWALLQLLVGLSSLRGTCRMLGEGGGMGEGGRSPAVSSVRSWLFRIGLYVFQQPVPERRLDCDPGPDGGVGHG